MTSPRTANRSVPAASVIPVLAYPESVADVDPATWGGVLEPEG